MSKVVRLCVSNVDLIIALVNELWTLEMGGSASEELAPTFFLTQIKTYSFRLLLENHKVQISLDVNS